MTSGSSSTLQASGMGDGRCSLGATQHPLALCSGYQERNPDKSLPPLTDKQDLDLGFLGVRRITSFYLWEYWGSVAVGLGGDPAPGLEKPMASGMLLRLCHGRESGASPGCAPGLHPGMLLPVAKHSAR